MNKMNLMTGDLVVCVNGKKATVMKNTVAGNILRFHTEKDSFSYLETRYNDNLTHKTCSGLTIVKVYRADPENVEPSKIGDLIANPEKMEELGKVIYERGEASAPTLVIAGYDEDTDYTEKPTIESLLTGDMLVHRNGNVSTIYKDTPFGDITRYHTQKNSFSYLYKFDNEALTHESKSAFDIIGVFRGQDGNNNAGDMVSNPAKMLTTDNVVWAEDESFAVEWFRNGESGRLVYPYDADYDTDDDNDDCDDDLAF